MVENDKNEPQRSEHIEKHLVSFIGKSLILFFLTFVLIILIYSVIVFLPGPSWYDDSQQYLFLNFSVSNEVRLALIVVISGALGSTLHNLRVFYKCIRIRNLERKDIPMFIVSPVIGGAIALIFYLVARAGYFSPQTTVEQTNPYGTVAISTLVGLFTEKAILKLDKLSDSLLTDGNKKL